MLSAFRDGATIPMPARCREVQNTQPHRYYDLFRTDDLFIKRATGYFFDAVKFSPLFSEQGFSGMGFNLNPIRHPDPEEYPANLDVLRERYPALADTSISPGFQHFLLIHKLHHERITQQFQSRIPDAAFVVLTDQDDFWPAVIQRAVDGKTLAELVHQPAPREERGQIAQQLAQYYESPHVDFAFGNFVWSGGTLFYVDSKPTIFRTERRNEEQKRYLAWKFVRPYLRSPSGKLVYKSWWEFWRS